MSDGADCFRNAGHGVCCFPFACRRLGDVRSGALFELRIDSVGAAEQPKLCPRGVEFWIEAVREVAILFREPAKVEATGDRVVRMSFVPQPLVGGELNQMILIDRIARFPIEQRKLTREYADCI